MDFTIVNEVVFNQILVSCDSDELTDATLSQLQAAGEVWLGGAVWQGQKVLRISVCSWMTTEEDKQITLSAFQNARLRASSAG